uniref:Uncharacterized protein n=1 Tax=viral metagenome TaxID=1070528 RepID=A0A6M3J5H6_9ZZZZ
MEKFDRTAQQKAVNKLSRFDNFSDEELYQMLKQKEQEESGKQLLSTLSSQFGERAGGGAKAPSPIDELAKIQAAQMKEAGEARALRKSEMEEEQYKQTLIDQQTKNQEAANKQRYQDYLIEKSKNPDLDYLEYIDSDATPGQATVQPEPTITPEPIPTVARSQVSSQTPQTTPIQAAQARTQPIAPNTTVQTQLPSRTIVVPDPTTGNLKEIDNPDYKEAIAQISEIGKSKIGVEKEVASKEGKDILTAQQDMRKGQTAIKATMGRWIDVAQRQYELTGTPPGPIAGFLRKLYGATKTNEFMAAFHGQLVEHAAAVGRIAIPGSRAARIISLFKKTAPTDWDTLESAAINSSASFKNAILNDMTREPWAWVPGWENLSEEQAKQEWDYLGKLEEMEMMNTLQDSADKFEVEWRNDILDQVYEVNPNLMREDYREEARIRREEKGSEGVIAPTEKDPLGLGI